MRNQIRRSIQALNQLVDAFGFGAAGAMIDHHRPAKREQFAQHRLFKLIVNTLLLVLADAETHADRSWMVALVKMIGLLSIGELDRLFP